MESRRKSKGLQGSRRHGKGRGRQNPEQACMEARGKAEQFAGKPTGNRARPRETSAGEGRGCRHGQEVAGRIKEEAGKALNKPDMEAKGKAEAVVGKAEKQLGEIERKHTF